MSDATAYTTRRASLNKDTFGGPAPLLSGSRSDGSQAEDPSVVDDGDTTAWAVPYTDLTMLLMVFFIVMLSQAEPKRPPTTSELEQDSLTAFLASRPAASPDSISAKGPAQETANASADGILPGSRGLDAGEDNKSDLLHAMRTKQIRDLEASTSEFLLENGLLAQVELAVTSSGIEIRMPEDVLFGSGSVILESDGVVLVAELAPLLIEIEGDIQVSGHTDDVPIKTLRFPSNWELSAARAIAVVRQLRDVAVPVHKMQAVGHGANRPVASNNTPEGRAKNRRVTIEVYPPLGFQEPP